MLKLMKTDNAKRLIKVISEEINYWFYIVFIAKKKKGGGVTWVHTRKLSTLQMMNLKRIDEGELKYRTLLKN